MIRHSVIHMQGERGGARLVVRSETVPYRPKAPRTELDRALLARAVQRRERRNLKRLWYLGRQLAGAQEGRARLRRRVLGQSLLAATCVLLARMDRAVRPPGHRYPGGSA